MLANNKIPSLLTFLSPQQDGSCIRRPPSAASAGHRNPSTQGSVTHMLLGREERYKEKPALAHVRGVRLMQQCTKAKKVLSSVAETVRLTQSSLMCQSSTYKPPH